MSNPTLSLAAAIEACCGGCSAAMRELCAREKNPCSAYRRLSKAYFDEQVSKVCDVSSQYTAEMIQAFEKAASKRPVSVSELASEITLASEQGNVSALSDVVRLGNVQSVYITEVFLDAEPGEEAQKTMDLTATIKRCVYEQA